MVVFGFCGGVVCLDKEQAIVMPNFPILDGWGFLRNALTAVGLGGRNVFPRGVPGAGPKPLAVWFPATSVACLLLTCRGT